MKNSIKKEEVIIPSSILTIITKCKNCVSKDNCDKYNSEDEDIRCPLEINIYKENYIDLVDKKGVDPDRFGREIREIGINEINLWRRRMFEASHTLTVTEASRVSAEANKISNTLIKLRKSLAVDRYSHLKSVSQLPEVEDNKNLATVFNQINNIFIGETKIKNKEEEIEIIKDADKRVNQLTAPDEKEIKFNDLKFDEFGVKIRPCKSKNKTKKDLTDQEKFPLVNPDTEDERYIPTRK